MSFRMILICFGVTVAGVSETVPMTEQAARGKRLFFEPAKGVSCANCHRVENTGTDAGPDLKAFSVLPAKAIATAIRSSRTAFVQKVVLINGTSFPGYPKGSEGASLVYWDLSRFPPAERKLKKEEIKETRDNSSWKHPPESSGRKAEELADIIAYLRWVANGTAAQVQTKDVEP